MLDLILPKGYLSHSQIELWLKSPDSYRKTYYGGQRFNGNMYTDFGNAVTLAMEKNEPWVQCVIEAIKSECGFNFSTFERDFIVDIDGIPFKGSIDQFEASNGIFAEQKTVMRPWSRNKINDHLQFDRYSLAIEIMDGSVNDLAYFIDARSAKRRKTEEVCGYTVEGDEEMYLTGEVNVIERYISAGDREREFERIRRVGREIAEDFAAYNHLYA